MTDTNTAADIDPRAPRRVRHENARRRTLDVTRVDRLTPSMISVTLSGDLDGFCSLGFDDHVKLFVPDSNGETVGRDYTPRRFDAAANTLDIEFAMHDAGPATRWAQQAKAGQTIEIGGPRGSFVIPTGYDWHLLIGDDTALPAIARRLEELPGGARALVIAEVDGAADEIGFGSAAQVTTHWVHRGGAEPGSGDGLARKLASVEMPDGAFYAWVACESLTAKALRKQLIVSHGAEPKRVKAAGYWRRGAAAIHETHTDD